MDEGLGKHGGDCTDASVAKKMQLGGKGAGLSEKSSWKKARKNKRQLFFFFFTRKAQDLVPALLKGKIGNSSL